MKKSRRCKETQCENAKKLNSTGQHWYELAGFCAYKYPLQQKRGNALKNVVGKIKTNITARKPLTITYNVTGKQVNLKAIKMLREFAIHTRQDIKSLNGGNI